MVLLLAIYYLVPIRETTSVPDQVMRGALALLVLVAVVTWITREVVRQSSQRTAEVNQDRLLLLVVVGLMFFALIDLVIPPAPDRPSSSASRRKRIPSTSRLRRWPP